MEEQYIKQMIKAHNRQETKIYLLQELTENKVYGFIALSATELNKKPALLIDYLFTAVNYRKIVFVDLNNKKVSNYLLEFSLDIALQVRKLIAIKYILLEIADDKLKTFYQQAGFQTLPSQNDWMFKPI